MTNDFAIKDNTPFVIFWFRRDLRLNDNKGLYYALKSGRQVLPLFIFDNNILDPLPEDDHRVFFIYRSLAAISESLGSIHKNILVKRGDPFQILRQLVEDFRVEAVYCNKDHEPYGLKRDYRIGVFLKEKGVGFNPCLDHLVMGKEDVLKADGSPYLVFTPYSRRWKGILSEKHLVPYASEEMLPGIMDLSGIGFPDLAQLGLKKPDLLAPALRIDEALIRAYHLNRDYPGKEGTTRLGVHLRFGTVSIRDLVKKATRWNEVFLNELIWREFYAMILWHHPWVVDKAFKPEYDRIEWINDKAAFESWKNGTTGYPMVDAGMRQLNQTGYMHNRLRMITASFLSKHLLIDWRWGEAYFAGKLFDYELSSNNGGWQWRAGTGCDAAPYFRIFNPMAQQKKFDPDGAFVGQWVPEAHTRSYSTPIVDHARARARCLKAYQIALKK